MTLYSEISADSPTAKEVYDVFPSRFYMQYEKEFKWEVVSVYGHWEDACPGE